MAGRLNALLQRFFRDGDAAAIEEIVARTRRRLVRVARRIGSPQDAEDTVQTAYHSLLRRGRLATDVPVEAWLVTAVVRIAYRRRALASRERGLADRLACEHDPAADPSRTAARAERATLLREEVARLPAKYRDVVVLHHLECLPVAQVARLLGAPTGTVKTRLRRARLLLRSRLAAWAAYAVCLGPWFLKDALQRGGAHWGGVMQIKGGSAVVVVAVAASAAGYGAAVALDESEGSVRAADRPDARRVRALVAEVGHWRERARGLERRLADAPASPPPAAAAPVADPPSRLPVADAAASGVREDVLRAADTAVRASALLHAPEPATREQASRDLRGALAVLDKDKPQAFLAIVALLRAQMAQNGNYCHLLHRLWSPGLERHLLDLARDERANQQQRWGALRGLGMTDTPDVRSYLLDAADRLDNDMLLLASYQALAWLKEPRGVASAEHRLRAWAGTRLEESLLPALGAMGGPDAARVLLDYLERPRSGHLVPALHALARIDAMVAERAAERLLDGPRGPHLPAAQLEAVKKIAGRS